MLLHYFPRSRSGTLIPTQEYFTSRSHRDAVVLVAVLDGSWKSITYSDGIPEHHGDAPFFPFAVPGH